ncbi:MAG: hypothetical protein HYY76_12260 [Acidobacteria bacterium]|nr:hypothetical protein [Acidobacteriota bacterium]
MNRERVVLDTNVLISGALSTTSTPAIALERTFNEGQLLASTATLRELLERLLSPKLDSYLSRLLEAHRWDRDQGSGFLGAVVLRSVASGSWVQEVQGDR